MSPSMILFYIVGALVLSGSVGVVVTRNIVHAAFWLLVALMGVAGVFLLAFAEFLALVQVLIYGGAIVIVILFSLMLTRIQDFEHLSDNRQWPVAAILSVVTFGCLITAILTTTVPILRSSEGAPLRHAVPFETFGNTLFVQWAVPFEVASLVLLVALIGAVILVRHSGGRQ